MEILDNSGHQHHLRCSTSRYCDLSIVACSPRPGRQRLSCLSAISLCTQVRDARALLYVHRLDGQPGESQLWSVQLYLPYMLSGS
jgi:hypothetical protein